MKQRDMASWARHGGTLFEMALATPQVIAHRTTRMLTAGASPNARDRREFARMGQEKVDAVTESLAATSAQILQAQQAAAVCAAQAWMKLCLTPWSVGTLPNIQTVQDQMLRTASSLVGTSMKPLHRRVTANAKRLSRVKL